MSQHDLYKNPPPPLSNMSNELITSTYLQRGVKRQGLHNRLYWQQTQEQDRVGFLRVVHANDTFFRSINQVIQLKGDGHQKWEAQKGSDGKK